MTPWKYIQPTGPTLDITKKPTGNYPFPYMPDERTAQEIDQDNFEKMQQQYEYERETQSGWHQED